MSTGFDSEPRMNPLYNTGKAHFQYFNFAVNNTNGLGKKEEKMILAKGIT